MAGLLDFLNTPESRLGLGLLSAGMASPVPPGQRLAQVMQGMDEYQNNQLRQKMLAGQIAEQEQQAKMREIKAQQAMQKQGLLANIFGTGVGISTGGGMAPPPALGTAEQSQAGASQGRIANMSLDQIAQLKSAGIDLMDAWKIAQQGLKQDAGAYYKYGNGQTQYMPKLGEGMMISGGNVITAPGYSGANADIKGSEAGAVEAAKYPYAVGQDAARQTLSARLDPVKTYNPQTNREEYVPRAQVAQPQYSGSGYAGGSAQNASSEQRRIIQSELDKLPANHPDRPALEREMQRIGGVQPSASGNYAAGPSAQDAAQNEATRVKLVEQAKADVVPTAQRENKTAAANDMLKVIDMLDKHPGRETATGASGVIDLRNYIPGTDARDFSVALDQLKGKTFLQAFESLKGGGQITEVEGKKATEAIGRLNTAQSDKAFKQALGDLRGVVESAVKRTTGEGGATGGWGDKPKGNVFDALPAANSSNKGQRVRDTTTGKILRSNGMQWKEE